MADRLCSNCGQELSDDASFCPSCGQPVHETAHVPTPEADVPVPPPPGQQQAESATTPPPQGETPPRRTTANKLLIAGCAVLGLLAALAVVVIVVVVAVVAGSGGGGREPDGGGSGGGSDALDEPPTIACEVGQPCALGEATVTVTKFKQTDLLTRPKNHRYRGNWVIVQFDYVYNGNTPTELKEYDWKLEDGEGRAYNYSSDHTIGYDVAWNRNLFMGEVNPGVEKEGVVIFEAAPDAKDFTLRITDLVHPRTSKKAEIPL